MKRLFTFLCAFAICFCAFAQQPPVYVTPTGAGTMSGNSWANARSGAMLRQTLKTTPANFTAQQVWVQRGTYKPTATTARDSCFVIAPFIEAYGGFNGNESSLVQRNIVANPTVLSGDIGVAGDTSDNTYHVVMFEIGANNLLDGFTVRDGHAAGDPNGFFANGFGGGILQISQGPGTVFDLNVRNCTITHNYASSGGGGFGLVAVYGLSRLYFQNCNFTHNSSYAGGGIHATGNIHLNLLNCHVDSNTVTEKGGGLLVEAPAATNPLTISRCSFDYNKSDNIGGGMAIEFFGSYGGTVDMSIDSSTINHNVSQSTANALYLQVWRKDTARIRIANTDISYNRGVVAGGSAVAAWMNTHSVKETRRYISNSRFSYNAEGASSYVRAPLLLQADSSANQYFPAGRDSVFITNCLFLNNSKGQGIYALAKDGPRLIINMTNTTVYGDSAHSSNTYFLSGGAEQYDGVHPTTECAFYAVNSLIAHTTPSYLIGYGYEVYLLQSAALPPNAVSHRFTNCYVSGTPAGGPFPTGYGNGGGNLLFKPLFLDTANNDFRLACNSPGVNAGNNALYAALGGGTKDLDGRARIYNSIIDMGAYEQDPTTAKPVPRPVATKNGLTLTYSTTTNADTLIWDFGNGTKVKARSGSYTYSRANTYTVCLRAVNACGFRDSCFRFVAGNPSAVPQMSAPATSGLVLAPNPAENSIQISGTTVFAELRIYNSMGQCVETVSNHQQTTLLDVNISRLPAGMYLVKAITEKGQAQLGKFLKR